MTYNNFLKKSLSSKFDISISKYINSTEIINKFSSKPISSYKSFPNNINEKICEFQNDKTSFFTNKKKIPILKSFSENNLLEESYKTTKNRIFSSKLHPCKVININKKYGFHNRLALNIFTHNNLSSSKKTRSNKPKKRNRNLRLNTKEFFNTDKQVKSPIELLLEKKENEYNIKIAHKPKISNQKLLSNFLRKKFAFIRNGPFKDNFYYIKSQLNKKTKCAEKKLLNQEVPLKFDDEKYKTFRAISKRIKANLSSLDKKVSIEKQMEQIKRHIRIKNIEKISILKEDIEDNKILYTPKNFLKFKKDSFSFYKYNQLIQNLNCNFTYKNRFIFANKYNIYLDEYISK